MATQELSDISFGPVGVFDDDRDQARVVKLQLEDQGVETVIAPLDDVHTLESAVAWIKQNAAAVICDVQLSHQHAGIQYNGAELLSRVIVSDRVPSVLTTGFKDDVGMWVRPHRAHIPVLVSRDETEDAEVLLDGMRACQAEIRHGRSPERLTHRVPLYIEKASIADVGVALDARVGGWSRKASMRFPAVMLGAEYNDLGAARQIAGYVFFARVNLGARDEADLFFEDVEPHLTDPRNLELHFEP